MFFTIIEKSRCVYFVQKIVKTCAAASDYIFYFSRNAWLVLAVFKCFLKKVHLLPKDINERLLLKENVHLIFFVCVAARRFISMFFNERAAASEKILTTASEIY